jgi:hypothetical protein
MAKKQTRRSISVSRNTYERLKAFCETNNISMSQFVETRVGDFLGDSDGAPVSPSPAPSRPAPSPQREVVKLAAPQRQAEPARPTQAVPMTSAAARYAIEPPPPIIKPKADTAAPKPAEKRPDQIFTF